MPREHDVLTSVTLFATQRNTDTLQSCCQYNRPLKAAPCEICPSKTQTLQAVAETLSLNTKDIQELFADGFHNGFTSIEPGQCRGISPKET